jgi:hypothetical protein
MGTVAPAPDPAADGPRDHLFIHVVAETPLDRVDVIRRGNEVRTIPAEGKLEIGVQVQLDDIRSGDFVYVRAIQEDLGTAWSSPIFFE